MIFRWPLEERLPPVLESICDDLRKTPSQEECLRRAYETVVRRFKARRTFTYLLFWKLLRRNPSKIWDKGGFAHCTHLNHFVALLLVRSDRFREDDIEWRWTLVSYFSPHQYLRVRLKDGRRVIVDPWGHTYGVPFGDYAHGLNTTAFPRR